MADASKGTSRRSADFSDPFLRDPLYPALQAYITLLRGIFRRQALGHLRWSPDKTNTGIRITGQYPINMDDNERRPAIVVVRQAASFSGLGLDGTSQQSLLEGSFTKADLIGSSMLIHCLGTDPREASMIGIIVARHIKYFHHLLQQWSNIHATAKQISIGQQSDPGSIVKGASYPKVIDVPVVSPFHVRDVVEIGKDDVQDFQLAVRDITMLMKAELGEPRGPTKPKEGGSFVDPSRELPGGEHLGVNPPTWNGQPLVPVPAPGQPSKPLRRRT